MVTVQAREGEAGLHIWGDDEHSSNSDNMTPLREEEI